MPHAYRSFRTNERQSSAPAFGPGTNWRLYIPPGRAFGVSPGLLHPPGRLRIANRVEEPGKERETIPSLEPEAGGVRRKASVNAPG
jgi:hypothetical protein